MTELLVMDTSTHTCGVGVLHEGQSVVQCISATAKHAQVLLPMIEEVMNEAGMSRSDLQAIGVVVGPGSFMGVRTAICTAQALAFALSIPVIPMSSLAVLAQTAYIKQNEQRVIAAWDARMKAFYWGAYELSDGVMKVVGQDALSSVGDPIDMPWEHALKVGNAWETYQLNQTYDGPYVHDLYLMPEAMLALAKHYYALGHVLEADEIEPMYLRNKVAKTLREREGG